MLHHGEVVRVETEINLLIVKAWVTERHQARHRRVQPSHGTLEDAHGESGRNS